MRVDRIFHVQTGVGKALSLMALLAVVVLGGCSGLYTPEKETGGGEEPPYSQVDGLFVEEGEEGGGVRTVFTTSNPQYWTQEGLTMWTVWGEDGAEFRNRTVTMGKSSGYSGGGYGIVFCEGEYEVGGYLQPAMLVVMVNNEGNYIIGKTVGGVFTDFGWWKGSGYLNRGTGSENEIEVRYEEGSGVYQLTINGHEVETFRDEGEPVLEGGRNGYIAVVTPYDQFPETELYVYYVEEK